MLTLRHSPFELLERLEQQVRQTDLVPAAEVQESQTSYTVVLELPGVDRGSIDVQASDRSLVISAKRESQTPATDSGDAQQAQSNEAKQATPLHSEFNYGLLKRSFQFPVPLERTGLQARYRDGLLTVTAPKAQTHTPVTVRVED
ncbi:Hsp20/alpha crystallin family protein [Synechococcus sp. CS-602]|uniref:Hsp20/alpha crystallin family protein n=1 Tax=Synechococcaceae TaxID=1890426 RepID=UPI0008FF2E46|nr:MULTISPECIES: Hsp20/alpha crystallin family protein [Synechococcaceae]MCT4364051.1 Hsp20/alpha crystallin family protein [Candidatus Regnicoccus frigidus MAG-AL1]APD47690.1 heat-shock protein [Synechococcus sp. SynAce01]MCT0201432.1 Hsp20/alpha crystallin family protein [Synechococcus sp. CS-603]MCT0205983.1 Hsp20/alpha crystallin family protein [Synechococcus sp. CS-602]MCT0245164.1 Hsp20/alpha crystallin family protein [Synechococcus sp. CS-601]